MPNKNYRRGYIAERYILDKFKEAGFSAVRARGSDGRAIAEHKGVDIRVDHVIPQLLQSKRSKKLPNYLHPDDDVNAQVLYQDGGGGKPPKVYAVIKLDRYIELLQAESSLHDIITQDMTYDEEG